LASTGKLENNRSGAWLLVLFFLLGLACLVCPEAAESGVATAWVRSYNEGNKDWTAGLALDRQGNVYVSGTSQRPVEKPNGFVFNYHFATIKYSHNGRRLWVRRHNSPGSKINVANALAVDGAGNVYIAGNSNNNDYHLLKYDTHGNLLWESNPGVNGQPSALSIDSRGNVYVFGQATLNNSLVYSTIKYSPKGRKLWVKKYKSPGSWGTIAKSMAVDRQGNVYVTGYSYYIDGQSEQYAYATLKYDTHGTLLWESLQSIVGEPVAVAVDGQGNVYVTGGVEFVISGNSAFITIKYNADGKFLWKSRYMPGIGSYYPVAMAIDDLGNVYITGGAQYRTISDYFTIKYDTNGTLLWQSSYIGGGPMAMTLDGQGNVYVSGWAWSDLGFVGIDFTTIKYNSHGEEIWVQRYNSPTYNDSIPVAIAADSQDNVYATGFMGVDDSSGDYVTIRYIQSPRIER